MNKQILIGMMGVWLASGMAHAGINSTPELPAQLTVSWTSLTDAGAPSMVLEATGSATLQAGNWVADVNAVEPGLIHVGVGAGLVFRPQSGWPASQELPVWKDITLDYTNQRLTGDAYLGGKLVANDATLFRTGGFDFGPDLMPKGQSLLWASSPSICGLTKPDCISIALWAPEVYGAVSVASVPEASTGVSMVLGLLAVGGLGCLRRRVR
jgi:MYXO-CTERM domain-containing protein